MTVYRSIIAAVWLVVIAYWAISAIGAKRSVGGRSWRKEIGLRLAVALAIVLALRVPALRDLVRNATFLANNSALSEAIGVMLTLLGAALAVTSRFFLGRNWGVPRSRKEKPELVTAGPYALIRHPIYTSIIFMMLGLAFGVTSLWLVPLVVVGSYVIYSGYREEQIMLEQFPTRYPAYKKRTKMFVPFIF